MPHHPRCVRCPDWHLHHLPVAAAHHNSSRTFSARYPRPSQEGFSLNHGPAWRKILPRESALGLLGPYGDGAAQPPLRAGGSQGPEPQQYILERQVQPGVQTRTWSSDQTTIQAGLGPALRGSCGPPWKNTRTPWNDHRPQEGEGESLVGSGSLEARKSQGLQRGGPPSGLPERAWQARVVKSVSSMSENPSGRGGRSVRVQLRSRPASCPPSLPQRGGMAPGRKAGSHSVASCAAQLCGGGATGTGLSGPSASGLVVGPARPAVGPRQTKEALDAGVLSNQQVPGRTTTSG